MIHAKDVAAVMFFCAINKPKSEQNEIKERENTPCIFIVSLDHETNNSIAEVCRNYLKLKRQEFNFLGLSMPWRFPYYLRKLIFRPCNRSDLNYSSAKLLATDFRYSLGLQGAIRDISENT